MSDPTTRIKQIDYHLEWKRYRKRRNLIALYLVLEFLGCLPFVVLVASAERKLFGTTNLTIPAALIWGAICLFTVLRLGNFPCPRCSNNFFGGVFAKHWNLSARNCASCGLER
jgi:hypothetical protein